MNNETDRIQNAIRHIQTAVDVDDWAREIAVEAMEKQIPMKTRKSHYKKPYNKIHMYSCYRCPSCNHVIPFAQDYCGYCGQKNGWTEDEG